MAYDTPARIGGESLIQAKVTGHGRAGALKREFTYTPFSVWNTRDGYWIARRNDWLSLGIESEIGRAENMAYSVPETLSDGSKGARHKTGTSVFDPVVCELAYRWWCPTGGIVLDPFAGGSVRGIVASNMGLRYYGVELRSEQVTANKAQATRDRCGKHRPAWVQGDAAIQVPIAPAADFMLTCPPYGNLERYSNDAADLSAQPFDSFVQSYHRILSACYAKLNQNSFACIVVGNYRDRDTGQMRDLVGCTIAGWEACGGELYNEITLINSIGTAAMRTNMIFVRGCRKVVRVHQTVLVLVKGCCKAAAAKLPPIGSVDDTVEK